MKTIAILGLGVEGNFWKSFIEKSGLGLVIASNSSEDNQAAIDRADVIIITLPMSVAGNVISSCQFRSEQLVISAVGEWTHVSEALALIPCEWVLLHRMCGPVPSMEGQNLIIDASRAPISRQSEWFIHLLEKLDANEVSSNKEEHDTAISITQTLLRLLMVCFFMVLLRSKIHLERVGFFSSPPFRVLRMVMIRILGQGADLCFDMLSMHVHSRKVIADMQAALATIKRLIDSNNRSEFRGLINSFEPLILDSDKGKTRRWFSSLIERGDDQ